MSMHKIPLTPLEESGLRAHGLDIGTPSQLSDAFRQGIAFALKNAKPEPVDVEPVAQASMPYGRIDWLIGETITVERMHELSIQNAKLYTHPPADDELQAENASLLRLLADIRAAVGDNGKRMQDELVQYLADLKALRDLEIRAVRSVIEWDKRRNFIVPYKVRDPLHAVIKAGERLDVK